MRASSHSIYFHTLSLLLFSTSIHASVIKSRQQNQQQVPGPYPVHYTGASVIDAATACNQLKTSIPAILANRHHEPLQLTSVISNLYMEGENPSTTDLFDGIPNEVLQPPENIQAAITSDGEWDRSAVIADIGYGEENDVQIIAGGLPSFCRFGANIVTSNESGVWFETWMPLPSNATTSIGAAMPSVTNEINSTLIRRSTSDDIIQAALDARTGNVESQGPASRDGWRGRLVFVGNSGQTGSVNYPEMKQVLTRYRESTASTNGGHFGSASLSNWTINNIQSQIDFGHRGVHVATLASQIVVKEFFGVKDRKTSKGRKRMGFPSYFKGCSTGGRQGFSEAQRYPKDYDGILAGSPAIFYNEINAYQIHVNSFQANKTSPRYIPTDLYKVIHKHIIKECDLNDGVADATIQNPESCDAKLHKLLCPAPNVTAPTSSPSNDTDTDTDTDTESSFPSTLPPPPSKRRHRRPEDISNATCLTADQLDNLRDIYKPLRYPDGRIIHEPVLYGSEFTWTVTDGVVGTPFPPAPGWYQYQVLNQTDSVNDFNPYKVVEGNFSLIQFGNDLDPGGTNTNNPDLSEYFSIGSKIIHTHGTADQLIPSGGSDRYHKLVYEHTQIKESIDHHYRYFHIPGMGHCRGGDGAWNFGSGGQSNANGERPLIYNSHHDALIALFEWVEYANPPEFIIGAAYKNYTDEKPNNIGNSSNLRPYSNGVKYSHKMCPYPKEAVLINPDDPYTAKSLQCQDP